MPTSPFDALLVLSFGGPESVEDVPLFLENVTRGRGVPPERLAEVAEHYYAVGGRSPINDLNRDLIAAIRRDLAEHDIDLPVYWGNRNWEPYVSDAFAQMAAVGVRHAAVFTTSAYRSYSSCRQYREDLFAASAGSPVAITRLPHYCERDEFVRHFGEEVAAELAQTPAAHVIFVTHSIPESMDAASGGVGAHAYTRQHQAVADRIAQFAGATSYSLAFCSRSGPPAVPWLEPDVNDLIRELGKDGVSGVIVVPIGFISDHMEVVHDLDVEARATAQEFDMTWCRVRTPGINPDFVAMIRQLVLDGMPASCPVDCCVNPLSNREVVA